MQSLRPVGLGIGPMASGLSTLQFCVGFPSGSSLARYVSLVAPTQGNDDSWIAEQSVLDDGTLFCLHATSTETFICICFVVLGVYILVC